MFLENVGILAEIQGSLRPWRILLTFFEIQRFRSTAKTLIAQQLAKIFGVADHFFNSQDAPEQGRTRQIPKYGVLSTPDHLLNNTK